VKAKRRNNPPQDEDLKIAVYESGVAIANYCHFAFVAEDPNDPESDFDLNKTIPRPLYSVWASLALAVLDLNAEGDTGGEAVAGSTITSIKEGDTTIQYGAAPNSRQAAFEAAANAVVLDYAGQLQGCRQVKWGKRKNGKIT
jgi:hypothetical protein